MTKQVLTEGTSLAVVEEAELGSTTPPAEGWRNLQPNSYGNFGPSFKKLPRDPISKNLQLRKGFLVDEDSALPAEFDLTKDLVDQFGEAIFRCRTVHFGGSGQSFFAPTAVDATGFVVTAEGDLPERVLVVSRGWENEENNGLFLVDTGSSTTHIKVTATGLVAETNTTGATVGVAGYRGQTGDLRLDADGNLISTLLNFTTLELEEEAFIVVGGRVDGMTEFSLLDDRFRGAAMVKKVEANKLTLNQRAWPVTQRSYLDLGTVCTGNVDTVVEAIEIGPEGDSITLQIASDGTGAGTLTETGTAVVAHVETGVTTVAQLESLIGTSALIRVKTADPAPSGLIAAGDIIAATPLDHGDEGPDLGTGRNVEFYFTKWFRNLPIDHEDYFVPSFAFEVTYPDLFDGQPGYEYLFGNQLDEWVWNFPLAGKVTINASFVGTRSLNPTDTRKDGPDDAVDPVTQAGLSTSIDLQRVIIDDVDDQGIGTDLQSLKVTSKNNVSPQKQLGKLGARLMNQGKHTAMVETAAIFTTDQLIAAVKDNRDARLAVLARNEDFGCLLHVQAMTFDESPKNLEREKSVLINLKATGHQWHLSTASLSVFEFLPPLPEEEQ